MEKIPQTLAERVDWLFRNIRRDNAKEHSFQDVQKASKELGHPVTDTYVWKMRNGQAEKPNWLILRTLAKFFKVPITFFYDEELTKDKLDYILQEAGYDISMPTPALRRIRKDPQVEEMAKLINQLDKEDKKSILQIIELIMLIAKK